MNNSLYSLGRELHFVKLPNFLSVESRPFDPDNYEDELEDESQQQEGFKATVVIYSSK